MRRRTIPLAIAALAVLGACGSDEPAASSDSTAAATTTAAPASTAAPATTAAPAFPVTVTAANGPVTVEARPERIVSLSPTATEMLFAIGAGGQVVAVDDQSTFPASAPRTSLTGLEPNLEAIAAYDPDLVVVSNDIKGVVNGLGTLDVPTLLLPAAENLDDTPAQMELLGQATGHAAEGATAATGVRDELAALAAEVDPAKRGLSYFHELDPTLYTAVSKTFIGQLYALAGLKNVADAADDGSGYPQVSAEYLVQANPDLVFLADTVCCQQDAAAVATRPGWSAIDAVRNGGVIPLDDDVASRWGPRIVEFLRVVVDAVNRAPAP